MATIRTSIALYDGVTSPLKSMQKAMNIVINSFETMQRTSGRSVDTSAIQEAREELARAGTAFDSIEQNIRDANQQQQSFNSSVRGGTSAADGLLSKVKGIAATLGGMIGAKKLLELSDSMTSTTARLNNAQINFTDGGSIDELEQKIMASAQRSRSYFLDTADAVAKLGNNAYDAFANMDEVVNFSELINKQFVIGGASAQEQSAAMLQLTQAMASGVLRGDELRSIFEQAPGIIQNIAKYLDVPIGQIRDMAADGQITAEIVKNATFAAVDDINTKFDSMPKTWGQIWNGMKNQALSIFNPILSKINRIGNSDRFTAVSTGLMNGLAAVARVATNLLNLFINIASVIVNNWSWISPIIMGIVAAMLIYNGVGTIAAIVNAASAFSAKLDAIAKAKQAAAASGATAATFSQTVAQYGLNAALAACPLTWIVILIIAVIAAIYAACAAVAKFTGVANSGFGVICGGVMVVISFFKNLGLSVANIALGIWNALGACASNIGTAFSNVISGVQSWFYNLLSTALTVVAGICEALNKLPFVEFDYSGITSAADNYAAKSAEAAGNKKEYTSVSDAFNSGMGTFDTFTDGWASDAFASGAAWGDSVSDKVSGLFDFAGMDTLGAFDAGNTLAGIGDNAADTAANTAATADALDYAEEDLQYLRDIAEREAINRFTTAEIKVEQHNTNNINSEMDVDGVMDAWANDFAEKLDVSEEGVHE